MNVGLKGKKEKEERGSGEGDEGSRKGWRGLLCWSLLDSLFCWIWAFQAEGRRVIAEEEIVIL